MALTQMALDSLDFDATVALAAKVAPHVDILEIGTPCIKHNGIKLLETLKAKFPKNQILGQQYQIAHRHHNFYTPIDIRPPNASCTPPCRQSDDVRR